MKQATVKYPYSEDYKVGILIENYDDIDAYSEYLYQKERDLNIKTLKSKEPISRIGHFFGSLDGTEKSIAALAQMQSNFSEEHMPNNPLYYFSNAVQTKIDTLKKYVGEKTIFINDAGGFCFVDGYLEVIKVEEINYLDANRKYEIVQGSKVINLENDPELEPVAVDYMENTYGKFSHIINMRLFEKSEFLDVLTQFKQQGGEYVYVYTTGSDVEQMYWYTELCLRVGLKEFIFDFNAGTNNDINQFITYLDDMDACVKLI